MKCRLLLVCVCGLERPEFCLRNSWERKQKNKIRGDSNTLRSSYIFVHKQDSTTFSNWPTKSTLLNQRSPPLPPFSSSQNPCTPRGLFMMPACSHPNVVLRGFPRNVAHPPFGFHLSPPSLPGCKARPGHLGATTSALPLPHNPLPGALCLQPVMRLEGPPLPVL